MNPPTKTKNSPADQKSLTEEESLETAMSQLDAIIDRMESGNLPLDRLLEDFEKGASLIKVCQARLGVAEKKIRTITKSLDGSVSLEPFQIKEEDE